MAGQSKLEEALRKAESSKALECHYYGLTDQELEVLLGGREHQRVLGELRAIRLRHNRLTRPPREITSGTLRAVTRLVLAGNQIVDLPPDFFATFVGLLELDLSKNLLAELPAAIGTLTKLEVLNVERNKLSMLPDELGSLVALRSLNIRENPIDTLPTALALLGALEQVQLGPTRLKDMRLAEAYRDHGWKRLRDIMAAGAGHTAATPFNGAASHTPIKQDTASATVGPGATVGPAAAIAGINTAALETALQDMAGALRTLVEEVQQQRAGQKELVEAVLKLQDGQQQQGAQLGSLVTLGQQQLGQAGQAASMLGQLLQLAGDTASEFRDGSPFRQALHETHQLQRHMAAIFQVLASRSQPHHQPPGPVGPRPPMQPGFVPPMAPPAQGGLGPRPQGPPAAGGSPVHMNVPQVQRPPPTSPPPLNPRLFEALSKKPVASDESDTGSEDDEMEEHEPEGEFEPIVRLAAVEVKTMEEDEDTLFAARAKLYRFAEGNEWKERGTGDMKVLKHRVTGKVRILMRREKTLKICANHVVTAALQLQPFKPNPTMAITWVTPADFSEEEARPEKFCARFRDPETLDKFKKAVEEAAAAAANAPSSSAPTQPAPPKDGKGLAELFAQAPGQWKCPACLVANKKDDDRCPACQTPRPGADPKPAQPPSLANPAVPAAPADRAPKYTSGVSPFGAGSSTSPFGGATAAAPSTPASSSGGLFWAAAAGKPLFGGTGTISFGAVPASGFGGAPKTDTTPAPLFGSTKTQAKQANKEDDDEEAEEDDDEENPEEHEPEGEFEPIVRLAAVEVKTMEEDEDTLFAARAKLYRFAEGNEWKERGTGDMKVLKHRVTGKVRILMRREKTLKICANHVVTAALQLQPFKPNPTMAITWVTPADFSEEEARPEKFCARFRDSETLDKFKKVVEEAAAAAANAPSSSAPAQPAPPKDGKGLAELFAQAPGQWKCPACLVANKKDDDRCPACQTPRPGAETKPAQPPSLENPAAPAAPADGAPKYTFGVSPFGAGSSTLAFGGATAAAPSTPASSSGGLFGAASAGKPLFGGTGTASFGAVPASGFGGAPKTDATPAPLFGGAAAGGTSFAGIPASGFGGKKTDGPATPAPLFGAGKGQAEKKEAEDDDDEEESDGDDQVEEHEPEAEFEPIVRLAAVEVKTMEEDEDTLFVARAKLYRFAEGKEWKERGTGDMKVLKHRVTGKVRILMRREKTLKICANHVVTAALQLQPFKPNPTMAITWVTPADFSEEEARPEKFCARFRDPETLDKFKKAVEEAAAAASNGPSSSGPAHSAPPKDGKGLAELFAQAPGQWKCPACLVANKKDDDRCPACQTPRPGADPKPAQPPSLANPAVPAAPADGAPKYTFGAPAGNTEAKPAAAAFPTLFGAGTGGAGSSGAQAPKPLFGAASTSSAQTTETKGEDKGQGEKKGVFSSFSFGAPAMGAVSFASFAAPPAAPASTPAPAPPAAPAPTATASKGKDEDEDDNNEESDDEENPEEHEPEGEFEPIVQLAAVEVKTMEEDEDTLFAARAKLYRFAEGNEWKERGTGDMKVLKHRVTGKVRILMRREKTLKICANHVVTAALQLQLFKPNPTMAITWVTPADFSEEEARPEKFCARFRDPQTLDKFKKVVEEAAAAASNGPSSGGPAQPAPPKDGKGLAELFAQAPGQWKCPACLVANKKDDDRCPACQTPRPGADPKPAQPPSLANPAVPAAPADGAPKYTFGVSPFGTGSSTSAFGGATAAAPSTPASSSGGLFGAAAAGKPLFGGTGTASFGAVPASGFGGAPKTDTTPAPLFGGAAASGTSFAGIPASGFGAKKTDGPATPAPLFGAGKGQAAKKEAEDDDDEEESDGDDQVEEHEPEGDFEPIVRLAAVEVKTMEEDEDTLFAARAKLYRFAEGNEWKERGTGDMKVLKHRVTGKVRILMRREKTLKICANHVVTAALQLQPFKPNPTMAITWVTPADFSEEEARPEKFCARFRDPETLDKFKKAVEEAAAAAANAPSSSGPAQPAPPKDGKGLAELFAQAPGQWKCPACLVANKKDDDRCPACHTPRPGADPKPAQQLDLTAPAISAFPAVGAPKFTFGVPSRDTGAKPATAAESDSQAGSSEQGAGRWPRLAGVHGYAQELTDPTGTPEAKAALSVVDMAKAGDLEGLRKVLADKNDPKPDLTAQDADGYTLLQRVAMLGPSLGKAEVLSLMADEGADVNAATANGRTALHMLAAMNDVASMGVLLNAGADPDRKDNEGHTTVDLCKSSDARTGLLNRRQARQEVEVKSHEESEEDEYETEDSEEDEGVDDRDY